MHERAEHGVAAHWKYKQNPNASSGDADRMSSDEQANWLRALVEMWSPGIAISTLPPFASVSS